MRILWCLLLSLTVAACSTLREPRPELSGTFTGTSSDGSPVVVNFTQSEQIVTAYGSVGTTPMKLSALVSPHGPALIMLDDGERMASDIALAADGDTATMTFRGEEISLTRGGSVAEPVSSDFQGRFESRGLSEIAVELSHSGRLVAGTGFFEGRPIAVVAHTDLSGDRADGVLLFSDESRLEIVAILSRGGGTLTIQGLGGPVNLVRR